jgi:hypothetical protein
MRRRLLGGKGDDEAYRLGLPGGRTTMTLGGGSVAQSSLDGGGGLFQCQEMVLELHLDLL